MKMLAAGFELGGDRVVPGRRADGEDGFKSHVYACKISSV